MFIYSLNKWKGWHILILYSYWKDNVSSWFFCNDYDLVQDLPFFSHEPVSWLLSRQQLSVILSVFPQGMQELLNTFYTTQELKESRALNLAHSLAQMWLLTNFNMEWTLKGSLCLEAQIEYGTKTPLISDFPLSSLIRFLPWKLSPERKKTIKDMFYHLLSFYLFLLTQPSEVEGQVFRLLLLFCNGHLLNHSPLAGNTKPQSEWWKDHE